MDDMRLYRRVADPTFGVAQVIQEATITVGEKGTVAVAATGIQGIAISAEPQRIQVVANHPFAFVIMDNTTGTPSRRVRSDRRFCPRGDQLGDLRLA